jgi:hypothetical protein
METLADRSAELIATALPQPVRNVLSYHRAGKVQGENRAMIDQAKLCGHWRLVSFKQQEESGEWVPALGSDPKGCISYWPDGRMQVLIGAIERPRFKEHDSGCGEGRLSRPDGCVRRALQYPRRSRDPSCRDLLDPELGRTRSGAIGQLSERRPNSAAHPR